LLWSEGRVPALLDLLAMLRGNWIGLGSRTAAVQRRPRQRAPCCAAAGQEADRTDSL
jgi:hypothetical protein